MDRLPAKFPVRSFFGDLEIHRAFFFSFDSSHFLAEVLDGSVTEVKSRYETQLSVLKLTDLFTFIGKLYVDKDEVARFERYVTIKK